VGTNQELIVYDISNPAAPVQGSVIAAPAVALALAGNYLYAAGGTATSPLLLVYDVSDNARPTLQRRIPVLSPIYSLAVGTGWLAAAMGNVGVQIYSLQAPAAPAAVWRGGYIVWSVAASGHMLYLAADTTGLEIMDVSNLQQPALVGADFLSLAQLELGTSATGVFWDPRGIAWVSLDWDGMLYGVDVRNPAQPRLIAQFVTGTGMVSGPQGVAASAGLLLLAGNDLAADTSVPVNLGLTDAVQPLPGQVLPDRYTDSVRVAHLRQGRDSFKARALRGEFDRPEMQPSSRPYRAERPRRIAAPARAQ
jgi:hypothetical protein